jgi:O-antigen ligase
MAFRKRLSAAHVAAMTGVLIAFCGVVLFLGLGPAIAARLTNADSINARYEYNEVGGMMFLDHPFFGAGLNNFRVESYHYDPTGLSSVFDAVPHNVFVLFASETGAFGLMCFVVIGLLLLWRAVALTKQPGDDKAFLVGSFSIAYLLGIAVSNMVDATLRFEPLIVQATLVAALVLSAGSWVSGPRDRKKESKLPVLGGFL